MTFESRVWTTTICGRLTTQIAASETPVYTLFIPIPGLDEKFDVGFGWKADIAKEYLMPHNVAVHLGRPERPQGARAGVRWNGLLCGNAYSLMQELRREIRTVRPDNCVQLWMQANALKYRDWA